MFETMRKVFGPVVVSVIIGAIALVFVFYGVFNPRNSSGMRGGVGGTAATVNGDSIPMIEFQREYQSRMSYYEDMFKGKAQDLEILKHLGIKKQIIDDLVSRKLITQEAKRMGLVVSEAEVREKIMELPYFKKDGKFDAETYNNLLKSNRRSPGEFEELVREDALRAKALAQLQDIAKVSEKEVQAEFQTTENKRQVEYVMIERDKLKKTLVISAKEISDFLAKPENIEKAKTYYEQAKHEYMTADSKKKMEEERKKMSDPKKMAAAAKKKDEKPFEPKYLTFDEAKNQVVTDLLRDRKTSDLTKMNKELADEAFAKAKQGDAAFKSFLKSKGLELKTSDKFSSVSGGVPGIGPVTELVTDAFADNSVLAKEPKQYQLGVNYVIARGLKTFKPVEADYAKNKDALFKSIQQKKSGQIYKDWMDGLKKGAKISINEAVQEDAKGAPGAPGVPPSDDEG